MAATAVFEGLVRRDLVWPPAAVGYGCSLALAVLVRQAPDGCVVHGPGPGTPSPPR